MKARLNSDEYVTGLITGNRVILAKAITLAESKLPEDQELIEEVLEKILPYTGNSLRIGITGIPGVGKSTFIEVFGKYLIQNHYKKIAVLTVDPSSRLTQGSILGDKTRMEELSKNPLAFIRPSASGEALGGITHKTREAILLCEAAGFDLILIETVGIGQSETAVKNTADIFLLLMLAGAGDELQGIKKGIMEMADVLAITKADGDNSKRATEAQADYQHALHLLRPDESGWRPKVLTCSALSGTGIEEIWNTISDYIKLQHKTGLLQQKRQQQEIHWLHECFNNLIKTKLSDDKQLSILFQNSEYRVRNRELSAPHAARFILKEFIATLKAD